MSILMSGVQEGAHIVSALQAAAPGAGGGSGTGLIDWVTSKNAAIQSLGRGMSITFAIIFVIYQAILSRGAMARVIVAGLAAAIFVWIVWNVTSLKDRVDNEVNALRSPAGVMQTVSSASWPVHLPEV